MTTNGLASDLFCRCRCCYRRYAKVGKLTSRVRDDPGCRLSRHGRYLGGCDRPFFRAVCCKHQRQQTASDSITDFTRLWWLTQRERRWRRDQAP